MSVYYNSVGEGWFKKNKVVNEAKYTANDLACTDNLKLMKYEGHRNILEIDLDTMNWDSKEVTDFLLKYLKSKNPDFYACQDIIDTTIQGAKRDGSDTVYIAFESKDSIVNEETNPFDKVEMLKFKMQELNFNGSLILERLERLEQKVLTIHNESEKNIIKNSLKDIEDLCKSYQKDVSIAMNNMFIKNLQDIKKLLEN